MQVRAECVRKRNAIHARVDHYVSPGVSPDEILLLLFYVTH